MRLKPEYYKKSKLSKWESWPCGSIDTNELITNMFGSLHVPGFGVVYSFSFGSPRGPLGHAAMWNAIKGWIVLPVEAAVYHATLKAKIDYYKNNELINNISTYGD